MMKYSDGPIAHGLSVLWDYIVLVSLTVVVSLPLLTIGVALHAALCVLNDFNTEEHSFVVSVAFLHYLKEQWFWFTVTATLVIASLFASITNLMLLMKGNQSNVLMATVTCVLAVLVLGTFMSIQIVGVQVRLEPMDSLRTAMMYFILNLPQNLLLLVVTGILLYLEAVVPLLFLVIVTILCIVWRRFLGDTQTKVLRAREVVQ